MLRAERKTKNQIARFCPLGAANPAIQKLVRSVKPTHHQSVSSLFTGDGLISLGSTQVYQSTENSIDSRRLLNLSNLRGHVFPVQVGNHFSYEATYEQTIKSREEFTIKQSCDITQQYDARRFHPTLTGAAYVAICNSETIYKRSRVYKGNMGKFTFKGGYVFFERLGVWIDVDPTNPMEHLVYSATPDRYWGSVLAGTSALSSVQLQ